MTTTKYGKCEVFNLTQHQATSAEDASGVTPEAPSAELKALLTFPNFPSLEEVLERAEKLADMAAGYPAAMVGGAPYLMAPLDSALKERGVEPVYAFSERKSVEKVLPDGSIQKTSVFEFKGFVGL